MKEQLILELHEVIKVSQTGMFKVVKSYQFLVILDILVLFPKF